MFFFQSVINRGISHQKLSFIFFSLNFVFVSNCDFKSLFFVTIEKSFFEFKVYRIFSYLLKAFKIEKFFKFLKLKKQGLRIDIRIDDSIF
jgi:hypothetical protein